MNDLITVRRHKRQRPNRPARHTVAVVVTLDNGADFMKLRAHSPGYPAKLEYFVLTDTPAYRLAHWLRANPAYRILSYRSIPYDLATEGGSESVQSRVAATDSTTS